MQIEKKHIVCGLCLMFLTFLPTGSFAQIALKLAMNRQDYISFEKIYAKVILRNDSGHAIAFGHDPKLQGELLFQIKDAQGNIISKISEATPPIIGLILRAGETKEVVVQVSRYYNLNKVSKYQMMAYVKHALFQEEYRSNISYFSVEDGYLYWSRGIGVPDFSENQQANKIKTRFFNIKTIFENSKKVYYLVVEDEKTIYAIRRIGYELGSEKPSFDVDMFSRLYTLLPISPRVFNSFIFDVNGKVEKREVYKKTSTIPALIRDEKGNIFIAGGDVAKKGVDYDDKDEKN
jgi:hypothetical protein